MPILTQNPKHSYAGGLISPRAILQFSHIHCCQ